jgi:hypothetical protein
MASNIYINDISTSTGTTAYVDLSTIKDIKLYNLDETNTISVSFDSATNVATEVITLAVKESSYQAVPVELPKEAKGGLLYYTSNGATPKLRITGIRI